jgi:hypothetical protein
MSIKKQAVWPDLVWSHLVLLSRDPVDARRRVVQALPWRLHFQNPLWIQHLGVRSY